MRARPLAPYGQPMSMTQPTRQPPRQEGVFLGASSDPSWTVFAGTILGLQSVFTFIYGIAAVSQSTFFVANAEFVLTDLRTLGWVLIALGVLQSTTAIGVMAGVAVARWAGVALAALNAVFQMIIFPAYPWWSAALFILDVLVIYGLIAHGGRKD
jgi:hypothetical protein